MVVLFLQVQKSFQQKSFFVVISVVDSPFYRGYISRFLAAKGQRTWKSTAEMLESGSRMLCFEGKREQIVVSDVVEVIYFEALLQVRNSFCVEMKFMMCDCPIGKDGWVGGEEEAVVEKSYTGLVLSLFVGVAGLV